MNQKNKIYSFFIFLALLFWNPLSFYLIYGDTLIYSLIIIHILYYIVFLGGITMIYYISRNRFNDWFKNILLTLSSIGILFSFLVLLDYLIGITISFKESQVPNNRGLIFKPHSKVKYKTIDFEYIAEINSLGLRDHEISIEKGNHFRILCFGDSWTYGWGVNIEDSWPKKLEQFLLQNDFKDVEVINCGQPGASPEIYKNNIEKIVPILKPDLVLVGILQMEDLVQLYNDSFLHEVKKTNSPYRINNSIKNYFKYSIFNILSLYTDRKRKNIEIDTEVYKKMVASIIDNFNHLQRVHFSTFPDSVQMLFKSGDLNPSLLNGYINNPDDYLIFNKPNHPATKFSITEMKNVLQKMVKICHQNNVKLIFLNLPNNYFTGHIVIRTGTDFLNPYFIKENRIDSIYQSISHTLNLPYFELTDHFLQLKNKNKYFFRFDGHPNKYGHEEMAKYIGEQLIEGNYLLKSKK